MSSRTDVDIDELVRTCIKAHCVEIDRLVQQAVETEIAPLRAKVTALETDLHEAKRVKSSEPTFPRSRENLAQERSPNERALILCDEAGDVAVAECNGVSDGEVWPQTLFGFCMAMLVTRKVGSCVPIGLMLLQILLQGIMVLLFSKVSLLKMYARAWLGVETTTMSCLSTNQGRTFTSLWYGATPETFITSLCALVLGCIVIRGETFQHMSVLPGRASSCFAKSVAFLAWAWQCIFIPIFVLQCMALVLVTSEDVADVVMNGLAILFIVGIDDSLYENLVPARLRREYEAADKSLLVKDHLAMEAAHAELWSLAIFALDIVWTIGYYVMTMTMAGGQQHGEHMVDMNTLFWSPFSVYFYVVCIPVCFVRACMVVAPWMPSTSGYGVRILMAIGVNCVAFVVFTAVSMAMHSWTEVSNSVYRDCLGDPAQ